MIIQVYNQKQAVEYAESAGSETSIISITSRGDMDVVFPSNPNVVSVLHMKFNDLTDEYDEEGIPYGRPLPQPEDFTGLKSFVEKLTCEILIIHCFEGKSRSAAVARAIYEFLGSKDDLRIRKDAVPNPRVYDLACRELGI